MKSKNYVEVKDKRIIIQPTESIILRERKDSKRLRTECHNINETQTRNNQKNIKNENNELEVKSYSKREKTKSWGAKSRCGMSKL